MYTKHGFQVYCERKDAELAERAKGMLSEKKHCCVIQVGDNPASDIYIRNKMKLAEKLGIDMHHVHLPADTTEMELRYHVHRNDMFYGCTFVQFPIPVDITGIRFNDADGLFCDYVVPATVRGIVEHLEYANQRLSGTPCLVIGRSKLVGEPMLKALSDHNATIMQANSHTPYDTLCKMLSIARIVVCAVGRHQFLNAHHLSHIRKDAIIYDVGINRLPNGKVVGDVSDIVRATRMVSPVPYGVGQLTLRGLMANIIELNSFTR